MIYLFLAMINYYAVFVNLKYQINIKYKFNLKIELNNGDFESLKSFGDNLTFNKGYESFNKYPRYLVDIDGDDYPEIMSFHNLDNNGWEIS